MNLEQSLRTQIAGAYGELTWDVNPLVTIGLSHSILSLKVTDAQLFRIVRGYVRQLAAAVHPDAAASPQTSSLVEERNKIMAAFELLDDEEVFLKTLGEFRNLKAEERHEIGILKSALNASQTRYANLVNAIKDLGTARRSLRKEKGAFNLQKAEEASVLPYVERKLNRTRETADHWRRLFDQRTEVNRQLIDTIRSLESYLRSPRFLFSNRKPYPKTPTDTRELSVMKFSIHRSAAERRDGIDKVPDSLLEVYRAQYIKLQKTIRKRYKGKMFLQCTFERHVVSRGCIKTIRGERIMGSLPWETMTGLPYRRMTSPPNLFVVRNLTPFLLPGSVLISLPRKKIHKSLSGVEHLDQLMGDNVRNSGIFRSGRIILDVK